MNTGNKSVEELLKPRYKVIAGYPGNKFKPGAVLIPNRVDGTVNNEWVTSDQNDRQCIYGSNLDECPHLFRKMEWFEERIFVDEGGEYKYVEEFDLMPQFIKSKSTGNIYKVIWYSVDEFGEINCLVETENGSKFIVLADMLPATQKEFEQQTNQNK
jgi:hypothetical protein